MTRTKIFLALLVVLFTIHRAPAQTAYTGPHGFLDLVTKDADGSEHKYVLFVPYDYKGDKPYPLILFLHGSGETGTDGQKQVQVGLGPAIRKQEKSFPFLALFPQSEKRTWQADSDDAQRALRILEEVRQNYQVDAQRIHLTGLSMGGFGTWSLAVQYPGRWAAIVPICGRGDPTQAAKIKDIPCWCFHGDADKAVKVDGSRNMIAALKEAGGNPIYTEYPGVGHNSWDRAYGTAKLYDWLLMQQLK
ncbi:MAG: alpha/beta hydrolase-fold protein [Gemmataceae bacterium]